MIGTKKREYCECLAAWVDSEPCICDEPIGTPMEVSAKKLSEANRLVSEIKAMDCALGKIKAERTYRTSVTYGDHGNYPDAVSLHVPGDIAAGLIRTIRFHALVKLSQTGVTTMASGYRPVVSA